MSICGVDTTHQITAADAAKIKQLGYGFVLRYINRKCQPGFAMTADEPKVITSADLRTGSVYVARVFTDCPGGMSTSTGAEDGNFASQDADFYGQPKHTHIILDIEDWNSGAPQHYKDYCAAFCTNVAAGGRSTVAYANQSTMQSIFKAFGGRFKTPFTGFLLSKPDKGTLKAPLQGPAKVTPPSGYLGVQYSFHAKVLSDSSYDADAAVDEQALETLTWTFTNWKTRALSDEQKISEIKNIID